MQKITKTVLIIVSLPFAVLLLISLLGLIMFRGNKTVKTTLTNLASIL